MKWYGKFFGALIGLIIIGGFTGLLIGLMIGHLFDSGFFARLLMPESMQYQQHSIQQVFFTTTFTIMGYLAKTDGRVTEHEIQATQRVMQQMGLNSEMRRAAIALFTTGKQPGFNWRAQTQKLRHACLLNRSLLKTFLEIQLQIVNANGHGISQAKRTALQQICAELGFREQVYDQFEHQSKAEQHYRHYERQVYVDPQQKIKDAYQILGVKMDASNAEIKKAYRRLMSKHHPDKLVAKGLPPGMMKLATEKTQKIKSAYEAIKKSRGL